MLLTIIQNELRLLLADRIAFPIALALLAMIGYGAYNGAAHVKTQRTAIGEALKEEQTRLAASVVKARRIEAGLQKPDFNDPRVPFRVGIATGCRHAYLPPAPLAVLSVGQSDVYPSYFQVSTRSKQQFINSDELENPNNLLSGRFDLAFVVIYLLPLVVLGLSYNVLSAEREQGTLALVLSQPVMLSEFLAGKICARAIIIVGVTVVCMMLCLVLAGVSFTAEGAFALALLAVMVVALYSLLWFAIALAVNVLGKSSATNAVVVVALWVALVVVAPALINVAATTLYPMPSRVKMITETRETSDQVNREGDKILAKYYGDHPEFVTFADSASKAAAMSDFNARRYAVQESLDSVIAPMMAEFDVQLARQQEFVRSLRLFSPALVMQEALNNLAGTGIERYHHFMRLVDEFQVRWKAFFQRQHFAKVKLLEAEYKRFPRYEFREEPATVIVERVSGDALYLLAATLLLGVLAFVRVRRFSVQ
jgi:ABC-2 type transport system permease protein